MKETPSPDARVCSSVTLLDTNWTNGLGSQFREGLSQLRLCQTQQASAPTSRVSQRPSGFHFSDFVLSFNA